MNFKFLIYVTLFMLFIQMSLAEVVVFSDYSTQTTLQDDHLHIHRELTLRNVGGNPIIPGELHFKIHEMEGNKKVASSIRNFEVYNDYDMDMNSRKITGDRETDLVISIWEPVLPKFSYKIFMDYDIEFEPSGLLFYELVVPVEETTIPIKDSSNEIIVPEKYHITHAPDAQVSKKTVNDDKVNSVNWEGKKPMAIEYSIIPLPRVGMKAVNLFWGVIITITLVLSYLFHRKLK
ncbi:MAG: hypothetical protein ACQESF_02815 [Nanobdellota archaeon]